MAGFGRGNITSRSNVSAAVRAENAAIASRRQGWTAREAQRSFRRGNQRSVNAGRSI